MEHIPRRSRLISLFYAAECGLKYLLMKQQNIQRTGELKHYLKVQFGMGDLHDIERLCLSVSILPADTGNSPNNFLISNQSFAAYKIHEAARYGVRLPETYIADVENWLRRINAAIAERMKGEGF